MILSNSLVVFIPNMYITQREVYYITAYHGLSFYIERKFEPQRYFEWNMMLIV